MVRAYTLLASGLVYTLVFAVITAFTMGLLVILLESFGASGRQALPAIACISIIPSATLFYFRWRGAKWRRDNPVQWAEEVERKTTIKADKAEEKHWLPQAAAYLALGSLGPANVYKYITDPDYLSNFGGWRILLMPIGGWMLTSFLFAGITTFWVGGVKRQADWEARANASLERWAKVGLWLAGIAISIGFAIFVIAASSAFLSGIDRGTALIAVLLAMILFTLWRIAHILGKRQR